MWHMRGSPRHRPSSYEFAMGSLLSLAEAYGEGLYTQRGLFLNGSPAAEVIESEK